VDFTTKPAVAGWIASHGNPPPPGRFSILYLAKEERLNSIYQDRLPLLRTVRISVDNLWRLQAQAGLFLHLPYEDKEELDGLLADGFSSIRFPYNGPLHQIPEAAIYPEPKSRLEILFDGFTTEQRLRTAQSKLRSLGLRIVPPAEPATVREAPAFLEGSPPPIHSSWSQDRLVGWLRPPPESFRRQDNPPQLILQAATEEMQDENALALQNRLALTLQEFMAAAKNARSGFVDFRLCLQESNDFLDGCPHPESRLRRTVRQDLADCWDGMRLFPYSDAILAQALSYLATAWFLVHAGHRTVYQTLKALLGPMLVVELGMAVGGQQVSVPLSELECSGAFRADLANLLKPEFSQHLAKPQIFLHQVNEPSRLFDFDQLVTVFGHRLVPGQFLLRQREVVFFSPAGLERLGNR